MQTSTTQVDIPRTQASPPGRAMATPTQTPSENSRFTVPNKTTQERISSTTVGLVALSDFRKRRAEVLEQQEHEARGAAALANPDRSHTDTPDTNASSDASSSQAVAADLVRRKKAKKRKVGAAAKLSFGDDDDDEAGGQDGSGAGDDAEGGASASGKGKVFKTNGEKKAKFKANASVSVVPRAVTKSALRREAAEREVLRREFLARQEAVKATEIAIPFVFYDGSNIPGGVVRVKKGDFIWVFLDKSRKVGADLGVGEKANARREWARIGVDDLMMVRGNIVIPHVSGYFSLSWFLSTLLALSGIFHLPTHMTPPPTLPWNVNGMRIAIAGRLTSVANFGHSTMSFCSSL
jgi:protein FAM50